MQDRESARQDINRSQGPIVPFRPMIAREIGINAALLLQQLFYWDDKGYSADGWTYHDSAKLEEETVLTYTQQKLARKILIAYDLIEEEIRTHKNGKVLYFRVKIFNFRDLCERLKGVEKMQKAKPVEKKIRAPASWDGQLEVGEDQVEEVVEIKQPVRPSSSFGSSFGRKTQETKSKYPEKRDWTVDGLEYFQDKLGALKAPFGGLALKNQIDLSKYANLPDKYYDWAFESAPKDGFEYNTDWFVALFNRLELYLAKYKESNKKVIGWGRYFLSRYAVEQTYFDNNLIGKTANDITDDTPLLAVDAEGKKLSQAWWEFKYAIYDNDTHDLDNENKRYFVAQHIQNEHPTQIREAFVHKIEVSPNVYEWNGPEWQPPHPDNIIWRYEGK